MLLFFLKKDINAHPVDWRIPQTHVYHLRIQILFMMYLYFQVKLVFKLFTTPYVFVQANDNDLEPTCLCKTK